VALACGLGASRGQRRGSCLSQTRVQTRIWLEVGDERDRQCSRVSEREGRVERRTGGPLGRGGGRKQLLGWAVWGGKKRRKKNRLGWALQEEKREGKKKERVGRAQREKEGEKEMHLNAFEFKFKI
jgi:hypothetical protein